MIPYYTVTRFCAAKEHNTKVNGVITKLTDKSAITRITILFAMAYMVSYITRINFAAVISAMETESLNREVLGIAVMGTNITYGAGQVISGLLGDRFSPKKLIAFGLVLTTAMNVVMSTLNNPFVMLVIWCINGFAQSFMWPPMVRIMTAKLTDLQFKKTNEKIMWGSSAGTIIIYLVAPLLLNIFGTWRAIFIFSAVCGTVMLLFWLAFCEDVPVEKRKTEDGDTVLEKPPVKLFGILMIGIMFAIVVMGMIRDAVTTWLPTYLKDVYSWENASSILSGVILPIFAVVTFSFSTWLYQNKIKNPIMGAVIFFGIGFLSAIGWYALSGVSAVGSIICAALMTGSMHGVNLMLICMVPKTFDKYGNVSTVSGVINACTYIGSAISTYGVARLSKLPGFGWNFNFMLWIGTTLAATIVCIACVIPWKKKFMNSDK